MIKSGSQEKGLGRWHAPKSQRPHPPTIPTTRASPPTSPPPSSETRSSLSLATSPTPPLPLPLPLLLRRRFLPILLSTRTWTSCRTGARTPTTTRTSALSITILLLPSNTLFLLNTQRRNLHLPRRWMHLRKDMPTLIPLGQLNLDDLVIWDHFMLQLPPGSTAQLGDDNVAVPEEVDIKIHVRHRRARDVDLGDVGR